MSRIEELRAKRAEIDAEIQALESAPTWEPTPGEPCEFSDDGDKWIRGFFKRTWKEERSDLYYETTERFSYLKIRPLDWTTVPDAGLPKAHPSVIVTDTQDGEPCFQADIHRRMIARSTREKAQAAANALIVRLIRGIK